MTLSLILFGSAQVLADGSPATFESHWSRALLIYMALESNRPHQREALAALFWPDKPQTTALTNLRQTLARLRRELPEAANAAVVATKQTIELRSSSSNGGDIHVDVVECVELLSVVARHTHTHEGTSGHIDGTLCPECVERLRRACELYRGEFLKGISLKLSEPFEEWLLIQREYFHGQALRALQSLTQHYEAVADYARMREYAARQLELEPLLEEAHGQVMRALAYAGDRAAALAQFEACKRVLDVELGIEPSVETVALAERIRSGDGLARVPALSGQRTLKHNLPEHLTAFVGRDRELEVVIAHVRSAGTDPTARLLTLVGLGGMGKTRLAIETARRCADAFADGAFFVSLASLSSPEGIVPAIAAAIGLSLQGSDPKQQLLDAVRARRLLLVLDNFEHVIDGADIAASVLQASADSQVIVTSRERLNVQGEHIYAVEGLDYALNAPDGAEVDARSSSAVRLFVQSARRAQVAFRLDDATLPGVVRICELVGGMPLGLELAAAWTESLSPGDIATEIERSADFLAYDWRDVPERQLSLRTVFDWSWRLLSEAERAALCRLSVFRGGFTRDSAQAVADADLRVLSMLARKSLLRRGENGRYEMHELIRQFAAERLEAMSDARDAIAARHGLYYLDFVAQRERRLARSAAREACQEIRADIDNVRQAWRWAARSWHTEAVDAVEAVDALNRSAYAFWRFLYTIGAWEECAGAFRLACEGGERAGRDGVAPQNVQALSRLTAMYAAQLVSLGKNDGALDVASRAITLAQHSAEPEVEALSTLVQGQVHGLKGRADEARVTLERAARLARDSRERESASELMLFVECDAYAWLSNVALMINDYPTARAYAERGRTLSHALHQTYYELIFLTIMVEVDLVTGDLPAARQHAEAALSLARTLDDAWGLVVVHSLLASIEQRAGDYSHALELWMRSLMFSRQIGNTLSQSFLMCFLSRLHTLMGNYAFAQQCLDDNARLLQALETPTRESFLRLLPLALLDYHTGHYERAFDHAERAWHMAQSVAGGFDQARALLLMGHAQAALNHMADAAASFGQALDIFERLGLTWCAVEAEAGLALVALAKDDATGAKLHAEAVLRVLNVQPWVGMDSPFFVYLACYRVLDATGDARAGSVLRAGHALLQACADRITDDALRRSFLHNVPANRELLALARAHTADVAVSAGRA